MLRRTRQLEQANQLSLRVSFKQPGQPEQSMSITGDFNGWSTSATPMRYERSTGSFEATVPLPPGRYRYQVVIDGRSRMDAYNDQAIIGETGVSTNSFTIEPVAPA